ncbi:hypothetical protein SKAU_G00420550 [Synaphobranchus kaupii]|uniref:Ig-like domain-containing protein n=1 Tax=Synaphobranchus kaupii TaxID=118154 RepID=A0A9Q1E6J3_SYNKA|nr:hypothetical protein SKAU_G00420550 [Synaphobranchus kaupii]
MEMSVFTILILTFLLPVMRNTFTLAADLHLVGVKGRTVELPCSATDPQLPGCWLYNKNLDILCWGINIRSIYQFRGRVKLLNNNSLELSNLSVSDTGTYSCYDITSDQREEQIKLIVRDEDSGEYRCVASNQVEGRTWSHSATFRLSVHSPISDISLTVEPQHMIVFEGQPLVLHCRVKTGSEPIFWSWFRIRGRPWDESIFFSPFMARRRLWGEPEDQLVEESERDLWLGSVEQSKYYCRARQQYDGHNITLDSDAVHVLILPKPDVPAPHPMVWVTLALSGCAVLGIAVLSWRRRTHTHTLERGQTELQAMPTSSKPSRIHETSNHQQSTGQDDVYCPLSGNRNEELYDTLN